MHPEEKARLVIDKKLEDSGYILQDFKEFNPSINLGVIVRNFPIDSGFADYLIFIDKNPVGIIEAKKSQEGEKLIVVEEQSKKYLTSKIKWSLNNKPLRFAYETTDILTRFTDYNDKKPRSREIFSFHKPETLQEWIKEEDTLRNKLKEFPELSNEKLRDCQFKAINNLEKSFSENRPRALIQMATGSGKTYTAVTSVYRLLKFAKAKRILFLVDTRNLGKQAEQEFMGYIPQDDKRRFIELYNIHRLKSNFIPKDSQVCISTIQRMYSILKGEEIDVSLEDISLYEMYQTGGEKEVSYNSNYPPEFFDFIIIDECHRSIYNLWEQVLDYFDSFLIGLTATPDKRTFGFFHENIVSEYSHEQAVIDGVNVGYDVYIIETEITKKGGVIPAQQYIDKRNRLTRKKRWEQLDEEVIYTNTQLDKDVVNPSQIRNVIKTFKEKLLKEIFPNRKEVPKTLIFAKTDSHADDIIQTVREEFGEGNDFCKKITYKVEEDPDLLLNSFRNAYNPRIAVTVDMIATGTDVKPIECLLFMRDVKSKNYFEQMKGRGTRTLNKDDLKKVTPSANENKTHFVIIDAVGVTKSIKTDSRPLERKPTISLKDLMLNVAMGNHDEDTYTSLANRLTRLDKIISDNEKDKFENISDGKTIKDICIQLLSSYEPDYIIEEAKKNFNTKKEPDEKQYKETQNKIIKNASVTFYSAELRDYIENVRKSHEQIIDTVNIDTIIDVGWDKQQKEKSKEIIKTFKDFINKNKNEIIALKIFYSKTYKERPITHKMIKELYDEMMKSPYNLTIERLWYAYYNEKPEKVKMLNTKIMLTNIISLLRYELSIDKILNPFIDIVNTNFKEWVFKKNAGARHFTEEQMEWLRMIKDHIASSCCIDKESFELSPFDKKGGLGKFYQIFGDEYLMIIEEMNKELTA